MKLKSLLALTLLSIGLSPSFPNAHLNTNSDGIVKASGIPILLPIEPDELSEKTLKDVWGFETLGPKLCYPNVTMFLAIDENNLPIRDINLKYFWSFEERLPEEKLEGKLQKTILVQSGPYVAYQYMCPGTYKVTLVVEDKAGKRNTYIKYIDVISIEQMPKMVSDHGK